MLVQRLFAKRHALLAQVITLIRVEAWLAVLLVIVLSVVPGNMRPHVLPNGNHEHLTAYFITGILLGVGYSRAGQLLLSAVMLSVCAGALEIAQIWIPERTASLENFFSSTFGAWTALSLIALICCGRSVRMHYKRTSLSCRDS